MIWVRETYRHPRLSIHLAGGICQLKASFFSNSRNAHRHLKLVALRSQAPSSRNGCIESHIALKVARIFLCVESLA